MLIRQDRRTHTYFVRVRGDDDDEARGEAGHDVAVPEPPVREDLAVSRLYLAKLEKSTSKKGYRLFGDEAATTCY